MRAGLLARKDSPQGMKRVGVLALNSDKNFPLSFVTFILNVSSGSGRSPHIWA